MPTYVTTVGSFGAAIADRLAADPPSPAFAVHRVRGPDAVDGYRNTLAAELALLLRAAATGSGGRLDLVLIADVAEVGGPILRTLAQATSETLAENFGVMFPPDAAAEQRGVGLVVVLATPAFDRSVAAADALAAISALEAWHRAAPPSPILDRILVLPRQNEVMPLSANDAERAVALFVSAAYRAGLRDSDAFRARLGPPRDPSKLVDAFAIAAADIDVPALVATFGQRSQLAALAQLAVQCEGKSAPHIPDLDVDAWIAPLHSEAPAITLTAKAGTGSPAELDALVRAVDSAEGEVLTRARRAIHDLVDARLGGDDALRAFSAVQHTLARAAERAGELAKAAGGWIPSAELVAHAEAEAAAESAAGRAAQVGQSEFFGPGGALEDPRRAPSPVVTGLLLGLCAGAATAALTAVASVRATATAGGAGAKVVAAGNAVGADSTMSLIWGAIATALVAAVWIFLSRLVARKARDTADPARAVVITPRAARTRRHVAALEVALAIRRRRAARATEHALRDERARLAAAHNALLASITSVRAELVDRGVIAAEDPGADDYTRALPAETPLHLSLVPSVSLVSLWSRSRAVREPEVWAARLLASAWPRASHRDDLPFAPGSPWDQVARDQHAQLLSSGAFEWPELSASIQPQLERLLSTAAAALGLGVRPRATDATLEPLPDARELLVIIPPEARTLVERALSAHPVPNARVLIGPRNMSRVLLLRTSGPITTASLARGAQ